MLDGVRLVELFMKFGIVLLRVLSMVWEWMRVAIFLFFGVNVGRDFF